MQMVRHTRRPRSISSEIHRQVWKPDHHRGMATICLKRRRSVAQAVIDVRCVGMRDFMGANWENV